MAEEAVPFAAGGQPSSPPTPPGAPGSNRHCRGSVLRRADDARKDHLYCLVLKKAIREEILLASPKSRSRDVGPVVVAREEEADNNNRQDAKVSDDDDYDEEAAALERNDADARLMMEELKQEVLLEAATAASSAGTSKLEEIHGLLEKNGVDLSSPQHRSMPLETKVNRFTYSVPVDDQLGKIVTVYNSSVLYSVVRLMKRLLRGESIFRRTTEDKTKTILDGIDLVIEPGKSYLLLGPPGSGRSTLLKAIAGILRPSDRDSVEGSICYNGRTLEEKGEFHIENAFAYIDQLDKHAPRLTVRETLDFACRCKGTGFGAGGAEKQGTAAGKKINGLFVELILASLGLSQVHDTFVGDATVRGVSGGQRRRVTVGEMLGARASVLCGDEISTGLDASSTFDMIQVLVHFSKVMNLSRVISLLQPSPETVSLFDEIIVLAEGKIIYAGPVEDVEDYFAAIGFVCPQFVDVADFLQSISTGDGAALFSPSLPSQQGFQAPTITELAAIFRESEAGKRIREKIESPPLYLWNYEDGNGNSRLTSHVTMSPQLQKKYANSFLQSTRLIVGRFLILWIRDKRVIFASAAKNIIMGLSVGGCYLSTDNPISIQGALFQAGLFIVLGAMQSSSSLVTDRIIYYKHADANFYSAWPFTFGRIVSQLPQTLSDTIVFATLLYFMVGLSGRDSASNFFIYLSLLFVFALLMNQQLAVFASFASAGELNAYSACVVLFLVLFCGFIVVPDTIPLYYSWIYWWNPFAWVYRALVVNEFWSGRWENPQQELINAGFVGYDGVPYGREWIGYAFAYLVPYTIACSFLTGLGLKFVRNSGGTQSSSLDQTVVATSGKNLTEKAQKPMQIPFQPVTLSFRNLCYDVTASTSSETIRLLQDISGVFRPGRLCALMGSSGAGKTTLLDVVALRKRTGTVSGEILMNGWPQEVVSFRRCSGFVYQFDEQSPELTVRETITFSAKLRLDPNLIASDKDIEAFVDHIMNQVELTGLRDALVGTDETFGLSFEQKKRLSIAVELAASPSVIFLDEPTSGLDARSALLVVKTLRGISDSGRTVVATIHQPSSAVFGMFDDLLLLRKGGEVVYHGGLGNDCCNLINYFESRGAPPIELGDNPANWMLRVMDSGVMGDLAESYLQSADYASLCSELDSVATGKDPGTKIEYKDEFAATPSTRRTQINWRLRTIYWRSPSYNLSRLVVSLVIAFVLGSVFVTKRNPAAFTETEMRARVSVVFLTFIITGIQAVLSVLPVMTMIRDLFYIHRDAGMYDSGSMGLALGVAEKGFIVVSAAIFTLVFLATSGITAVEGERLVSKAGRCIGFWGFFTFNFAIYSYFGQLFVCLVKPMATAIILSSVFIGLNNFFSGLVVRPQFMVGTFYEVPYWITPGHFVYDGLITVLYRNNNDAVTADPGSEFEQYLQSEGLCSPTTSVCQGTAYQYVNNFFGNQFMVRYADGFSSNAVNAIILGFILTLARVLTFLALKFIRHSN